MYNEINISSLPGILTNILEDETTSIKDKLDELAVQIADLPLDSFLKTVKLVGTFFLTADYSKYALGFIQLASMAELGIVIRHYVQQMKRVRQKETNVYYPPATNTMTTIVETEADESFDRDNDGLTQNHLMPQQTKASQRTIDTGAND